MGTRCWFINWKFTSSHSIQVFDYTAKIKNQKKVNNHYVVTQTSSALQRTQQKCFSWAPVKVLTRRPWCVSKSFTIEPLSFWLPKKALFPIQLPESASIWGFKRFGLWETSLPGNFLPWQHYLKWWSAIVCHICFWLSEQWVIFAQQEKTR